MPTTPRVFTCLAVFSLLLPASTLSAQRVPNSNSTYVTLRSLLPGGEVIEVNNFEWRKDAAVFTLRRGSVAFCGEVNGKVTGAVFLGDGHLHIAPPTPEERHNLAILTKSEQFDEDFTQAVFRFTDQSAAELRKASNGKGQPDPQYGSVAIEANRFLRTKLTDNLHLRLLEDVLSSAPGGYFSAMLRGKTNPHLIFTIDPRGAEAVAPEEVSLMAVNDWGVTIPTAFHRAGEASPSSSEEKGNFRVSRVDLDVTIEKNGFLSGLATIHVTALADGVAVLPLNLYPTLRVSRVETDMGEQLDWVQEKKEEDADFGVILAKPLNKGETAAVRVTYGGKDVVLNKGNDNYYPVGSARENWYPNGSAGFGHYADYHMLFHVPKGLELIATGTRVSESSDGKSTTTKWKTEVPLPVAGFNLGQFLSWTVPSSHDGSCCHFL